MGALRTARVIAELIFCLGRGKRGSLIARITESKDREEDNAKKSQADTKTRAFAKPFRQRNHQDNGDDEIEEWDEQQNDPPQRLTDDLQEDNDVVDGDDGGPTRLPCLRKDLP